MNAVLSLILSVFLSASSDQPGGTGTLEVKITDSTGTALRRTTAQLLETRQGAYANDSGTARIKSITPGSYTVVVTYIGCYPDTLHNVRVDSNRTTLASAVLHERRLNSVIIKIDD